MKSSRGAWGLLLLAAVLTACAPSAVVVVSPGFRPERVKSVAVPDFADFRGAPGSGDAAANVFEKYLLQAGWRVVGPSQADALAIGALSDYTGPRDETVMVDIPQERSDPIFGRVVTVQNVGDARVRTVQNVVTGYAVTRTNRVVPRTQTVPAHVAMTVRLLDAKTNELLWSVSSSASDDDLPAATETASASAMKAVLKRLKKAAGR